MTTRSTDEAMAVLSAYRRWLIDAGRRAAVMIALRDGTVHSRQVRGFLAAQGLLDDPSIGDYWLGAVFNNGPFKWTGRWHVYTDDERNIHERTIKVWQLDGDYGKYQTPAPPPPPRVATTRGTFDLGEALKRSAP